MTVLRAARFANALGGPRVPGRSRECRASSLRIASRTRTLKYFQSGDRAACGSLRQCIGRLAGPWVESRVPRLLTQGCFSHSDFEIFSVSLIQGCTWHSDSEIFSRPSPRVAPGTRTLKYFHSRDRAACGSLRQCIGRLAGPWEESRVPQLLTQGCCCHSGIPHQSPACGTLKYFRGPSPRVAPGTRTLKCFQSGDRAACGSLRECIGRLAGPWVESRVPRPLTQGCCCHSGIPHQSPACGTLKIFRGPS